MSAKQEAKNLIDILPESSSIDDIIAGLAFKSKVEKGLLEINNGDILSHEQVEENMKKWALSLGQN